MRAAIWGLTRAPGEPVDALCDAARELSLRYHAPSFLPHLTIVGKLELPDAASVRAASEIVRTVARSTCPLSVVAGAPQHSPRRLRAVLLPTTSPRELLVLRHQLAAALAARGLTIADAATEAFAPHVSLLYGDLPEKTREEVVALPRARALAGSLRVTALALASAGGPDWSQVSRWRVLTTAALRDPINLSC